MDKARRPHKEKTKEKIKTGMILRRLLQHFNGEIEMSASQVNVGLALLRKTLPDLKSIEQTGTMAITQTVINAQPEQSAEEWVNQHASSGNHSQARKPH